jgi:peptidoglycan hydrolase-like protein with peptidoglycan-binding domain
MKVIRQGSKGPLVKQWQEFLRGHELYLGVADGNFGPATHAATCHWQELHRLIADGIVGNQTWGRAMVDGLELVPSKGGGKDGPNWPPIPKDLKTASLATRQKLFGAFKYKPAPTKGNPEGIKILGNWTKGHIVRVTIPQLKGVYGAPANGRIFWHDAAVDQIKGLFQAWEDAGLIHLVRSWAGSWNPRFIRGSRSTLSNHSWATAFDINVPGNGLRRQPALVGQPWSVRELVPLANKWGFWWGGHWGYNGKGRYDGMHFEVAKLV